MKKILTSAFTLLLFAGIAQAQVKDSSHKGHHHGKAKHEMVAKQLNLTADQQARLKSIHEAQRQEMQSLKSSSLSQEEMKTKRQAIHEKYKSQTQSVFTADQKASIEKMKAERKAKGKDGRKDFKRGKGQKSQKAGEGQKMENVLNLSEAQKADMAKLRQNSKTEFEALKNSDLSAEDKKAKMMELRKSQRERMKSVLTAEQIQKLEGMKSERRKKPGTK